MKLKQRIVLGYYKTKLNTLGQLSPARAAESAFNLFCTPYSGKPKRKAPPIFQKATIAELVLNKMKIKGFQWIPQHPNHKKILICHGFDSSCYKFEKYIISLLHEGFEVMAFDAPGHGQSDGKTINALLYTDTILEIQKQFGSFNGIIGHSLGALAVSLAAEQMEKSPDKIVLIAPATETTTAIAHFYKFLPLQNKTREAFEALIFQIGGKPLEWFSVTRAIQNIASDIFWIHDKDDFICPFEDTLAAQDLNLPQINFLVTEGLGHSKIYHDQKVHTSIIKFLSDTH